jgi:hypothetical protein
MMLRSTRCLGPGLIALVLAMPVRATDVVSLCSVWTTKVSVAIPPLKEESEAWLVVEEFLLEAGDEPLGKPLRLKLGPNGADKLDLYPGHALDFSCKHAPGTQLRLPIRITGKDPRTFEPFAIGLVLTSTASVGRTELELALDPDGDQTRPPFQLLRMEPDPESLQPMTGFSLAPYGESAQVLHRLRSMPNLSSVSIAPAQPGSGCSCVIL